MTTTDVDLCSAALVKLGAMPIASLADLGAEAVIAARLYPIVRDAVLSSHPWAFTIATVALVADPAPPVADFAHAFALPADCLRTIAAGQGGRPRGLVYRVAGGRLSCDAAAVTLTYQRRPPPEDMPPHFVAALVARLAAEFCLPVTENASRTEVLHRLARAELQLARLVDSQQSTPQAIEDFGLITARLS
jgi:hypothetical protein